MYRFTKNWFQSSELRSKLHDYLDLNNQCRILEIGCYEGQSSVFFSTFLNHEKSSMVCVDPFLLLKDNDHKDLLNDVEERFDYNISNTTNKEKITVYKLTSDVFFQKYSGDNFDFIYIDGCHLPEIIENDIKNSLKHLNKNGIIWMDDYLGGDRKTIKNKIDNVLDEQSKKYNFKIIHKGYQIAIQV
jgi:predicted O-methyltransferase YrrM